MKIRVITPIYNEQELLPGFLRHYAKIADAILILDNGSIDGSVAIAKAHPRVELRTFKTEGYDVPVVMNLLAQAKDESVRYDWCLFPDCDELLTMRDGSSLRAHLEKVNPEHKVLRASGYSLIKHGHEAPFDGRKEWLGQRKFGVPDPIFSKPILIRPRTRALLSAGNHRLMHDGRKKGLGEDPVDFVRDDPAIVLLHFDMIDFYLWYYRKTRRPLSEANKSRGWNIRFCRDTPHYHAMWRGEAAKARCLEKEVPALRGEG